MRKLRDRRVKHPAQDHIAKGWVLGYCLDSQPIGSHHLEDLSIVSKPQSPDQGASSREKGGQEQGRAEGPIYSAVRH